MSSPYLYSRVKFKDARFIMRARVVIWHSIKGYTGKIERALASRKASSRPYTKIGRSRLTIYSFLGITAQNCVSTDNMSWANMIVMTLCIDYHSKMLHVHSLPQLETLEIEDKKDKLSRGGPFERVFLTKWMISSELKICWPGVSGTPSSGMQYKHRRLHLSVNDILRYVCFLLYN